ncbi:MAG TPA: hypothetical protein GXZ87_07675 [Bacteroidales bacterium]|nr:hypothetical protein [Bacteroidales bacterium]
MKQNVSEEGEKATDSINKMDEAALRAATDIKAKIKEQKSIIKQIESDIAYIQKLYDHAVAGKAKLSLGNELETLKKALEVEKNALVELESKVETTAQKHAKLRTEVMEAKEEVSRLEMAGKRGSEEWDIAINKLASLNDQMQDTNQIAKTIADDERIFKSVASGVSGLAGAMSAAVGVASLFGAEQEELTKIQTRLQSVMAITIGLQQVAETLNKDSYFRIVLLSKAKRGWAAAQAFLNTQLGIGVGLSKALMFSGVGLLIAGIGSLIVLYQKWSKKQEEELKLIQERLQVQAQLKREIADSYASEVSKIEAARAALNSENVTREQKLGIIDKLKKQIPGYTAELDTEGRLIRENTEAYNDYLVSLEKSLLLRAAEKDLEKLLAQKYQLQKFEIKEEPKPIFNGYEVDLTSGNIPEWQKNFDKAAKEGIAEIDKAIERIKDYIANNSLIDIPKPTGGEPPSTIKKEYDAQAELAKQLTDLRKRIAELEIETMQEGFKKKIAQIDHEEETELKRIEDYQKK